MKEEKTISNPATRQVNNKGIWKRFAHTIKEANIPLGLLAFYIVLTIIEGQILIRIPEVNGNFFAGDVSPSTVTMFIALELVNTVVVQGVLYVNHILRYKMNRNLRNALWGKILRLKPSYYDKVSSSSLISRISVDSDGINTFVLDVVLEFFAQLYYTALIVNEMNKTSKNVGFMLLAFLPLTFMIAFIIGRLNLKFQSNMKYKLSDLTNYLSEIISVLPLLKAMNRQGYESRRGKQAIDEFYKSNRNVIGLDIGREIIGSLQGLGPELVIILIGIKYLNNGTFDAASWYMFYMYAGTFISFCGTVAGMWENAKSVQGQLNKVSDVLFEEEESLEAYVDSITEAEDIIFDHVDFGYEEKLVIKDASFTIPGHKNTALIGLSGAGKSTIVKLVERMYTPNAGRILMGGHEICEYGIKDWRNRIAYVSQSTPLLSGSIRDNVTYGIKREVTDTEIMEALRTVRLDAFVESDLDGLSREVGQFGESLSGGQRQKISVARALLSDADILILDEPTASLDIISTNEIMQAVESIKGKRTVIMITHDDKLIGNADHIIALEGDHRISEGSPEEMMKISEFVRVLLGKGGEQDVE
ncbi:MAG: ABC transporter ATP-binding protein [Firmicutes bacterium]|nr:ABC transporter ATP-binding protein [Bacillota bacterium]